MSASLSQGNSWQRISFGLLTDIFQACNCRGHLLAGHCFSRKNRLLASNGIFGRVGEHFVDRPWVITRAQRPPHKVVLLKVFSFALGQWRSLEQRSQKCQHCSCIAICFAELFRAHFNCRGMCLHGCLENQNTRLRQNQHYGGQVGGRENRARRVCYQ